MPRPASRQRALQVTAAAPRWQHRVVKEDCIQSAAGIAHCSSRRWQTHSPHCLLPLLCFPPPRLLPLFLVREGWQPCLMAAPGATLSKVGHRPSR